MSKPSLPDGLRFAFGTLTVLPVTVSRWDRDAARVGMLCAPVAGLVVGLASAAVGLLILLLGADSLLAAVVTAAVPAALTRGLHLDGLADTADGLGSGRPALEALEVMRRGDVGPFGVVTLVLALLAQVAALAQLVADGHGPPALVAAVVVSRMALPLACLRGIPAARTDGLGVSVAGSVSRPMAVVAVLLGFALVGVAVLLPGGAREESPVVIAAAAAGLLGGLAVGWRAVRRFGGVTGDVLGAVVEATFTTSLVLLSVL